MAFRIDKAVVRGELSNEVRGEVTGEIWLAGRAEPLRLRLQGDCLRDLAGCRLRFSRARAETDPSLTSLAVEQIGVTGEMTGSRKVRRPSVSDQEVFELLEEKKEVPSHVVNSLYLEWYSETNGRVLIESADFDLSISIPVWWMTPAEEEAQIEASQNHFHQFIDAITGGGLEEPSEEAPDLMMEMEPHLPPAGIEDDVEPGGADEFPLFREIEEDPTGETVPLLDEFEWEQELRDADRRAEAYQEAYEKYRDHPDRERLIAEALGWDDDTDAGDEEEAEVPEAGAGLSDPLISDWDDDLDLEAHHPLSQKAMDFALALQREAEEFGLMGEQAELRDSPILALIMHIISLGGKLAGALDGWAQGLDPEPGFIIAMLKRAQVPLNEALHAFDCIDASSLNDNTHQWLQRRKRDLFDLRRDIIDVMQQLRAK